MRAMRICSLPVCIFLLLSGMTSAHAEDSFPSKPIVLVVPFPAGGGTDILARRVADHMSQTLGQPVVVQNRPGAGGSIGTGHVARSAGDGYTIVATTADTLAINPSVYKSLAYDSVKDFKQIAMLASQPQMLTVNQTVPAKSIQEFIDLAKSKPGQMSYASWGPGSVGNLAFTSFAKAVGAELLQVPFKGVSDASVEVLAGRVDGIFVGFLYNEHFKTGKLRPLAITSETRSDRMPNIPTMKELGFAEAGFTLWYGLAAPSSTPDAVVEKLSKAALQAVNSDKVKEHIAGIGGQVAALPSGETARFVAEEIGRWAAKAKAANIEPQ